MIQSNSLNHIVEGQTALSNLIIPRLPEGYGEAIVFVFGSNLAGIHGAGAALWAKRYCGALYGKCQGRISPYAYGIPTKETPYRNLSLCQIARYVREFINHAEENSHEMFFLSAIGTGLAGFHLTTIAPLLADAPSNVVVPISWVKAGLLPQDKFPYVQDFGK